MNKMDFLVEGHVRLLSVIPQPRNMAVVSLQVVWILCNTLLALLSGGEQCPAAGAVIEHSCWCICSCEAASPSREWAHSQVFPFGEGMG